VGGVVDRAAGQPAAVVRRRLQHSPGPLRPAAAGRTAWSTGRARHFQHPDDELNEEVASLDLALATGRGPRRLTDLDGLAPLVRAEDVALVAYRVSTTTTGSAASTSGTAVSPCSTTGLRAGTIPAILDRALATVTRPQVPGFWCTLTWIPR